MTGIDYSLSLVAGLQELAIDLIALVKSGGKNFPKLIELAQDLFNVVRDCMKVWPELKDLDSEEIRTLIQAVGDAAAAIFAAAVGR
jgi:hypothetical protein